MAWEFKVLESDFIDNRVRVRYSVRNEAEGRGNSSIEAWYGEDQTKEEIIENVKDKAKAYALKVEKAKAIAEAEKDKVYEIKIVEDKPTLVDKLINEVK